jgi:hypothetical protein
VTEEIFHLSFDISHLPFGNPQARISQTGFVVVGFSLSQAFSLPGNDK